MISADIASKINFAFQQNDVAFIRELVVANNDSEPVSDLVLELSTDPDFLNGKTWSIDRIDAEGEVRIKDREVKLNASLLEGLDEAIRGTATFRLFSASESSDTQEEIASESFEIEILARNEWGGADSMPELLSAFITPNDHAVENILKSASTILKKAGKNDALDGYQSGSRTRVWELASSVWSAIRGLDLTYAIPPASFESVGQKIRLPSSVLDGGLATCLDSTVLCAAVFEQLGLNPIVVLIKGHSLVGVWLQPEEFSTVIVDDPSAVRKRIKLKELILFESTLAVGDNAQAFSTACRQAEASMNEENDQEFLLAIDIRQARMQRIRPLPTGKIQDIELSEEDALTDQGLEEAPILPDFDTLPEEDEIESPRTRLEKWQRKLLDLTLRNKLLNFKPTRASVRLLCPNPALLEDKLATGTKISLIHAPSFEGGQERDKALHLQRTGKDLLNDFAEEALNRGQVVVDLPKEELDRNSVQIYRRARSELQEGGANTLYLALGFLVWKRDRDDRKFRAPLILVPVTMNRKSIRSGIKLSHHDDEARFNTTLLQMLRQDFSLDINGLDAQLPADSAGVDVEGIWNRIRNEVKDVPGFEVVEDVALSTFSFAKYLMWKDLKDRSDLLKKNSMVKHLIDTPKEVFAGAGEFPRSDKLDQSVDPSKLYSPLDADSSQLAAVVASGQNKDFVLIGPPGTGKSQTIANIICHNLALGRTVLFVAEKVAALDVVYRRLEQFGLGKFCLELHSNKAKKLHVLDQLRSVWSDSNSISQEEWEAKAKHMGEARQELNDFVSLLHKRFSNGLTPYIAMGRCLVEENLPNVGLSWPTPHVHSASDLEKLRRAVDHLRITATAVGEISQNPLQLVTAGNWSPGWAREVVASAKRLSFASNELSKISNSLIDTLGVNCSIKGLSDLNGLMDLADALLKVRDMSCAFALDQSGSKLLRDGRRAAELVMSYRAMEGNLSCAYDRRAWGNIDLDALATDAKAAIAESNIFNWAKKLLLKIKLRRTCGAKGWPKLENDLSALQELQNLGSQIEDLSGELDRVPGWENYDTDVEIFQATLEAGEEIRKAILRISSNAQDSIENVRKVRSILDEGLDLLDDDGPIGDALTRFKKSKEKFDSALEEFSIKSETDSEFLLKEEEECLEILSRRLESLCQSQSQLSAWCAWRRSHSDAIELGLEPLISALETGAVSHSDLADAFEFAYAKWWISEIVGEEELLREFRAELHENKISQFKKLDDEYQDLTRAYIAAKLSGKIESISSEVGSDRGTELGFLKRELERKRGHKPLRQLISGLPNTLHKLTPCLLMSPLSVAQYLSPEHQMFDLVIFDEASQITTWDAVGAIARGKQTIVAGDPKQLPPTSFFRRAEDDEDGDVDIESDLESILDELCGAGVPQMELNWHYRSESESLISFSNHKYYSNNLITFPSRKTSDRAVSFRSVDGIYERGSGRTNMPEARALVEEVVSILSEQSESEGPKSLGVVTFNSDQQRLIEDLLDRERRQHPEIDHFFDEDRSEPVFVKNLETVQGDERDIILFSITFGPDRAGNITMNFGPLNQAGGERRLNVAITRARSELKVFSSIRYDAIDLNRTAALGVRDLKHYLEFAEKGPSTLGISHLGPTGDFESPFEKAVAQTLRGKGWEVHPQIGVSEYRIDLGIVHPDSKGEYLAGVECDGATYHRTATARDRDKIREGKLNDLGWRLVRVWSTDWWVDPQGALIKIDDQLKKLLEESRKTRAEQKAKRESEKKAREQSSQVEIEKESPTDQEQKEPTTPKKEIGYDEVVFGSETPIKEEFPPSPIIDQEEFELSAERFYEPGYNETILRIAKHVTEIEGPIKDIELVRQISRAHGFRRAGRQIRELVLGLADQFLPHTKEPIGNFYWPQGVVPEEYVTYRVPRKGYRSPDLICIQELVAFCRANQFSSSPIDAVKRSLGMSRLASKNRQRIEIALDIAKWRQRA